MIILILIILMTIIQDDVTGVDPSVFRRYFREEEEEVSDGVDDDVDDNDIMMKKMMIMIKSSKKRWMRIKSVWKSSFNRIHQRPRRRSPRPPTLRPPLQGVIIGGAHTSCLYRVFFFHWASPKKLKYAKPWLGESTLT